MIVVDVSGAQSPDSAHRGIGRYNLELAAALARRHPDRFDADVDLAFAFDEALPLADGVLTAIGAHRLVPFAELGRYDVQIFHVAAPFEVKPIERIVPVTAGHLVVTHYDLIPWLFRDRYFSVVDPARYLARLGLLLHADAIVTLSRASAYDLEHSLGVDRRRVTVIGAGVGDQFQPLDPGRRGAVVQRLGDELGVPDGSIIVPVAMDWRKNPETAIAAFAGLADELRAAHPLVLTGFATPGHVAWLHALADEAGVGEQVVVTGYVDDDVLVGLYQTAALVVFPSRYEGFGLPVLEARRCAARVVCSGVSSLPEVLPLPSAWFDPADAASIAAVIERALTDTDFQEQLDRADVAEMSWDRAADRVAGVYRGLLSGR